MRMLIDPDAARLATDPVVTELADEVFRQRPDLLAHPDLVRAWALGTLHLGAMRQELAEMPRDERRRVERENRKALAYFEQRVAELERMLQLTVEEIA